MTGFSRTKIFLKKHQSSCQTLIFYVIPRSLDLDMRCFFHECMHFKCPYLFICNIPITKSWHNLCGDGYSLCPNQSKPIMSYWQVALMSVSLLTNGEYPTHQWTLKLGIPIDVTALWFYLPSHLFSLPQQVSCGGKACCFEGSLALSTLRRPCTYLWQRLYYYYTFVIALHLRVGQTPRKLVCRWWTVGFFPVPLQKI